MPRRCYSKSAQKELNLKSHLYATSKSQVFTCAVDHNTRNQILTSIRFFSGTLPIRYLGIPLVSSHLTKVDCTALVDRITMHINHRFARYLSYAGRLQLVNSILFRIQTYWSSMFILLVGIYKQIKQLMTRFLWMGKKLDYSKAKVVWKDIVKPKMEGGLGIKWLTEWSKAVTLKHLQHI